MLVELSIKSSLEGIFCLHFLIYTENYERVLLSKIFFKDSTTSQNFTIKYLEETFHSSLLSFTNISIERANLVTSKFKNSVLNNLKENLQEISTTVSFDYSFDEDDDF